MRFIRLTHASVPEVFQQFGRAFDVYDDDGDELALALESCQRCASTFRSGPSRCFGRIQSVQFLSRSGDHRIDDRVAQRGALRFQRGDALFELFAFGHSIYSTDSGCGVFGGELEVAPFGERGAGCMAQTPHAPCAVLAARPGCLGGLQGQNCALSGVRQSFSVLLPQNSNTPTDSGMASLYHTRVFLPLVKSTGSSLFLRAMRVWCTWSIMCLGCRQQSAVSDQPSATDDYTTM